jgi:hypothetical protein
LRRIRRDFERPRRDPFSVPVTINGKAELIVQDAAAYQKLRQIAEEARVIEGIRQGIEDMKAGRTVSLDEFKKHARAKHGIRM